MITITVSGRAKAGKSAVAQKIAEALASAGLDVTYERNADGVELRTTVKVDEIIKELRLTPVIVREELTRAREG